MLVSPFSLLGSHQGQGLLALLALLAPLACIKSGTEIPVARAANWKSGPQGWEVGSARRYLKVVSSRAAPLLDPLPPGHNDRMVR